MFTYIHNLFKKISYILPCVIFLFSFNQAAYAADFDFVDYLTFVENEDGSTAGWISGTSSTNGNVNMQIDVIVSEKTVQFVSGSASTGYNAALFVPNFPVVRGDVVSFTINSPITSYFIGYGTKINYDSSGLRTYNNDYVTGTGKAVSYGTLLEFSGTRDITFTVNEDGYFYFYGRNIGDSAKPVLDVTFSNIAVNGSSVGSFTPEEILNNGNSDTPGIVQNANDKNDELNEVVNEYQLFEDEMLSNFTEYQESILSDLNTWSWGGLALCANWVGDTLTDYYDNSGDFKQFFIYPLMLGIALFFIGRGSSIIGHLYRKPVDISSHTIRTAYSVVYDDGTKRSETYSRTTRPGGVLRK